MPRLKENLIHEPMLTPLTDAAMTLIVIFLMTLPAIIWSGFNVDSTRAEKSEQQAKDEVNNYIAISITAKGLYFNGKITTADELPEQIKSKLEKMKEKLVIVLPDDNTVLDNVVRVFDIAKLSGAERLALLKPLP
ncbi:MAG: biopolymer transporter ExbD [bacterium]